MQASEHLFAFFDELRNSGTPIPASNQECTRLILAGLNELSVDCTPMVNELEVDDDGDEALYELTIERLENSVDGLVNDLESIVEDWE